MESHKMRMKVLFKFCLVRSRKLKNVASYCGPIQSIVDGCDVGPMFVHHSASKH